MPHALPRIPRGLGAVAAGLLTALTIGTPAQAHHDRRPQHAEHVLLLSVDGLHQADLARYVHDHPSSALAALTHDGVEFTHAKTPVPSDSFPGMVAQATGGNPSSTGIYYDDTWNRALLPAGTTSCAGVKPGVEVTYFEQLDKDQHALDAGQGLAALPDSILGMTGNPDTLIDPTQLPVDPASCQPVWPHSYLRVNTIFEVARAAGLRTAWSDKHPAYEILNGPSGTGVQDLFTPEINSDAPTLGSSEDWTKDNALTQQYDGYKVQAVLNEIHGLDHSGTTQVGVPAIFGMNFQTVSTAEKLPTSGGQPGGYLADGIAPGPVLSGALDYVDAQVGAMLDALRAEHLDDSTVVIVSAKHGQSPTQPSALTRIPDGPILDALNAAWHAAHPSAVNPLVAFSVDDDAMLLWLSDRSRTATRFAKRFLLSHDGTGNDIAGNPKPYTSSGLAHVYAGRAAARYFGVPRGDARVPDLFGIVQHGVVYTGGHGKIAEHGGADPQDRDVPLVVAGEPIGHHEEDGRPVETTQIAPTILRLLGLDSDALKAVRIEGTRVLPLR
jgi:type I phosphodiesterase/nucleotide pyrophosphatase